MHIWGNLARSNTCSHLTEGRALNSRARVATRGSGISITFHVCGRPSLLPRTSWERNMPCTSLVRSMSLRTLYIMARWCALPVVIWCRPTRADRQVGLTWRAGRENSLPVGLTGQVGLSLPPGPGVGLRFRGGAAAAPGSEYRAPQ